MANASFALPDGNAGHLVHVAQLGVSCSTCHTAHGMGSVSANISGERLVNFDVNVVAPNGASPVSYSHQTNTCVLACHGYNHNADGTVSAFALSTSPMRNVARPR
jgi:hypothetical protein